MFVTFRAITYSTLFIGLLLIDLPTRILILVGHRPPDDDAGPQIIRNDSSDRRRGGRVVVHFHVAWMEEAPRRRSTRRAGW